MRACIYEQYGGPEVVRIADVPKPTIEAGELLVRVCASSVTTADWRIRASRFPRLFWLPGRLMFGLLRPRRAVLGMDFSGVVAEVGAGVTRFRVGDAVYGSTDMRMGAHAEYVVVREAGAVVHKPASLSHAQAAAVPFGANCALAFLRDFARITPGQRVAILGASGGVGVWAVQLARHLGAEVTAVCGAHNIAMVQELGAQQVIDYGAQSFPPPGQSYDVIFDTFGATSFGACKHALSARGQFLPLNTSLRELVQAALTGLRRGKRVRFAISADTHEALEVSKQLLETGVLKPVIDSVYPLSQIVAAHRRVDSRHKRGAVIVELGEPAREPAPDLLMPTAH